MRKRRPQRSWSSLPQLASMIIMLAVLGMAMQRVRDPGLWTWLTSESAPNDVAVADPQTMAGNAVPPPRFEVDPEERATVDREFAFVTDRTPVRAADMPAYWRLMGWANGHTFQQLQELARRDALFTHFWETPKAWRGELVELKLHVRRVLSYEVPENPLQLREVYEAWGWTDESQSFPYVIVFSELPPGMQIGADVREEITFVGFFLKVMSYQAGDNPRGAPLLIGRVQRDTRVPVARDADEHSIWRWMLGSFAVLLLISVIASAGRLLVKRPTRAPLAHEPIDTPEQTEGWLSDLNANKNAPDEPPGAR